MFNRFTKISNKSRLAKNPTTATVEKRKNCFEGVEADSLKTKYRVIKKLTVTPKKKDTPNDSVWLLISNPSNT